MLDFAYSFLFRPLFPSIADGFKRITNGKDKGGYYHEFFLRGRKGLLKKIKRKKPATPKATAADLAQSARIANAILSSGRYPHFVQQPSNAIHPQMLGIHPQNEFYANASSMGAFNSSSGAPLLTMRSHVYPPENETPSEAMVPGAGSGSIPYYGDSSSNGEYPSGHMGSAPPKQL